MTIKIKIVKREILRCQGAIQSRSGNTSGSNVRTVPGEKGSGHKG